jgi:23S rRNA (adenine1618-N6)-methyltransferase
MSADISNKEKTTLHVRNRNREQYDLDALIIAIPALSEYIQPNRFGEESVDFSNPIAVKLLNKALLSSLLRN